jgi:hypothetical protein
MQHGIQHITGTYLGKNVTNCVQTVHEPPSLRLHCSSLSTVSHPRAGTRLHPGKGFLTRLKVHGQPERLPLRCSLNHSLQPLLPHMPVPPKEVCPFSAQQSFGCPTSLPGLQQQARPEVSERCSRSLSPSGNRSSTIPSLREFLMGLTTRLFNPAPKLTGTPTGMDINLVWVWW